MKVVKGGIMPKNTGVRVNWNSSFTRFFQEVMEKLFSLLKDAVKY